MDAQFEGIENECRSLQLKQQANPHAPSTSRATLKPIPIVMLMTRFRKSLQQAHANKAIQ